MDEFSLRPVITGVLGGLFTLWVMAKWSRWIPKQAGDKDAATLAAENRWRILGANALFFGMILVGIYLFKNGYFPRSDWRGFGLIFGLACVAPVAFLFLSAVPFGFVKVREAFVAYTINQRAPLVVLLSLLGLGFVSFFVSVALLADA